MNIPPVSRLFGGYAPLLLAFLVITVIAWYTVPGALGELQAATTLVTPTVVVVECPAMQPEDRTDYRAMARAYACESGIDPDLFERQMAQESNFDPLAVSPAGAQGIAQFMPATAKSLGVDPWNPESALPGAAKLMKSYLEKYQDDAKALAAYNAGSARVDDAVSICRDSWRECIPVETQNYIRIILQEA